MNVRRLSTLVIACLDTLLNLVATVPRVQEELRGMNLLRLVEIEC